MFFIAEREGTFQVLIAPVAWREFQVIECSSPNALLKFMSDGGQAYRLFDLRGGDFQREGVTAEELDQCLQGGLICRVSPATEPFFKKRKAVLGSKAIQR